MIDLSRYLENDLKNKYSFLMLDTVDSTNTLAKQLAKEGVKMPLIIIADHQSAGRGRLGRSFYSPSEAGLYMSVLIDPKSENIDLGLLTQFAAVATSKAIEKLCSTGVGIKWVNDILIDGKKICGILCEAGTDENGVGFAVIGIGVNILQKKFPDDIKDIAGSIYSTTGAIVDRAELAAQIIKNLDSYSKDFMDDYRARSIVLGRVVRVINHDNEYLATAVAINDDGSLLVVDDTKEERNLCFGEISLRLDKDALM